MCLISDMWVSLAKQSLEHLDNVEIRGFHTLLANFAQAVGARVYCVDYVLSQTMSTNYNLPT